MRELPSQGRCLAAFLLASAARLKAQGSVADLLAACRDGSGFMPGALDLAGTAEILLAAGLMRHEDGISVDSRLKRHSFIADRLSLVAIAAILLKRFPPGWVVTAVGDDGVDLALVPQDDLLKLGWLGDSLEPILIDVFRSMTTSINDELRALIGTVGELAVISALRREGLEPTHVALISDAYGYDIEVRRQNALHRLEVKTCVPATSTKFAISKHEASRAASYRDSWMVVQVRLSSDVIVKRRACAVDVLGFRILAADDLLKLMPPPQSCFEWLESAEITPPLAEWTMSDLLIDDGFDVCFDELSTH